MSSQCHNAPNSAKQILPFRHPLLKTSGLVLRGWPFFSPPHSHDGGSRRRPQINTDRRSVAPRADRTPARPEPLPRPFFEPAAGRAVVTPYVLRGPEEMRREERPLGQGGVGPV